MKRWNPTRFLENHDTVYSVIVLNTPINNKKDFISICSDGKSKARSYSYLKPELAKSIVAADGGANRILDLKLTGENIKATVLISC